MVWVYLHIGERDIFLQEYKEYALDEGAELEDSALISNNAEESRIYPTRIKLKRLFLLICVHHLLRRSRGMRKELSIRVIVTHIDLIVPTNSS